MDRSLLKRFGILLLLSVVLYFFGNNFLHLTDPDEAFYSLTATEMSQHHGWLTPYIFNQPQFEKPIFTYWLMILAFKAGGVTPWAARFFPALFATLSVVGIYVLGLLIYRDGQRAFL